MRILICGDSYCVTDPDYPDLHWSEKILNSSPDYEIYNVAYGGCSNAMIILQLLHGLALDPDFVVFSFTSDTRYEIDDEIHAVPDDLTIADLAHYQKRRFTTNMYEKNHEKNSVINKWITEARSETFEKLKNYFFICFCLQTLAQKKIPFAFSLGGFEYQHNYNALLNSTYVENFLIDYRQQELKTNLWYFGKKARPYFHVDDTQIQSLFANECMKHINGIKEKTC